MNHRVIAQCQHVINELDAVLVNQFRTFNNDTLLAMAELLMAEPAVGLDFIRERWPKDSAAMMAMHFYRELLRRYEIRAMESEPHNRKGNGQ